MEELACSHKPKTKKMVFSCKVSGNYELTMCDDCYKNEDRNFLIAEVDIDFSDVSDTSKKKESN